MSQGVWKLEAERHLEGGTCVVGSLEKCDFHGLNFLGESWQEARISQESSGKVSEPGS